MTNTTKIREALDLAQPRKVSISRELAERLVGRLEVSSEVLRGKLRVKELAGLKELREAIAALDEQGQEPDYAEIIKDLKYKADYWRRMHDELRASIISAPPAPAQQQEPVRKGWNINHAQEKEKGVWELGFLDNEDDQFSPFIEVNTGQYYAEEEAEPLAKAILARINTAPAPQAQPQAVPEGCQHEWVSADNAHVTGASICIHCKKIVATSSIADPAPPPAP